MNKSNQNPTQSSLSPWVMLILCCFLGFFGVHKFVEKKIGVGLLYLFTVGLFGIGWLVDCIRYLVTALSEQKKPAQTTTVNCAESSLSPETTSPVLTRKPNPIKNIILWLAVSFMTLLVLGTLASGDILAGLSLIALIALLLPIPAWQTFMAKFIKKKLKIILAVICSIAFILGIGNSNTEPPVSDKPVVSVSTTTTTTPQATSTTTIRTTTAQTTTATTNTTTVTTTATTVTTTNTTTTTSIPATTAHIHDFAPATCEVPKTCSECGTKEGVALGHSWEDATCISPKRCSECGETSGSAAGHSYSDGACWVCGQEDPDYVSEKLVWIPTNGGECYHRKNTCSQMEDPEQVTESEAIALGFRRCGRCKP